VEGIRSYLWHITTKYYEADVHVCAMDERTIANKEFAESVNAVVLYFDSSDAVSNIPYPGLIYSMFEQVRELTFSLENFFPLHVKNFKLV